MDQLPPLGVILAGGAARRFGGPKALATVGGRPIVDRARRALEGATDRIVVSGDVPLAGLAALPDQVAGAGPLGGVLTALWRAADEGRPGVLVVGCDMPFLTPGLLRLLGARGAGTTAVAVVPESGGRRGFEPLCAWYGTAALPALRRMALEDEHALHRLAERASVERIPRAEVRRAGDPAILFFNVNTPDDLREAERLAAMPPVVAVVGRTDSGKTTLVVALLAELARRGWRVASVKHGHHPFEPDRPGSDSWRHFHEGGAAATLMVGSGTVALTLRMEGEPDPASMIRDLFGGRGFDLVVVEGCKRGPFPRIEVFRRALHDRPLAAAPEDGADWLAVVSDDVAAAGQGLAAGVAVVPLAADGAHVAAVAELVEGRFLRPEALDAH